MWLLVWEMKDGKGRLGIFEETNTVERKDENSRLGNDEVSEGGKVLLKKHTELYRSHLNLCWKLKTSRSSLVHQGRGSL